MVLYCTPLVKNAQGPGTRGHLNPLIPGSHAPGQGGQITTLKITWGSNMVFSPQILWKEIFSGILLHTSVDQILHTIISCQILRLKWRDSLVVSVLD